MRMNADKRKEPVSSVCLHYNYCILIHTVGLTRAGINEFIQGKRSIASESIPILVLVVGVTPFTLWVNALNHAYPLLFCL